MRICALVYSVTVNNYEWFQSTYNACKDCNPNSNGLVSLAVASSRQQFQQNSFLVSKPSSSITGKGSVYTRNIKKFSNCVNACKTSEQEKVISDTLDQLHIDIMSMSVGKKKSPPQETQPSSNPTSSIASLSQVETSSQYHRQKPVNSPSRH